MAFTWSGTSFCSTTAARTGTPGLLGGAALVPAHALNSARAQPARSGNTQRCGDLIGVVSSPMFLLPAMVAIVGFRRAPGRYSFRAAQHPLQPDFGQSRAYLLDGKLLIT